MIAVGVVIFVIGIGFLWLAYERFLSRENIEEHTRRMRRLDALAKLTSRPKPDFKPRCWVEDHEAPDAATPYDITCRQCGARKSYILDPDTGRWRVEITPGNR